MGHIRVCIGEKNRLRSVLLQIWTRKERDCLGIEISILHSPNRLTITGASCTEGDLNPGPRIWCKWGLGDGKPELFSLLNPTNSENISNTQQLPTVNRTQQRESTSSVLKAWTSSNAMCWFWENTIISTWLSKGRVREQDTEGMTSFPHDWLHLKTRSPCNYILMPPPPQRAQVLSGND